MKQLTLSKKLKLNVINILLSLEEKLFKHITADKFFDQVLDLRLLPSTDKRFSNALGDLIQHYINNPDWSLEYIFLEHDVFKFLDSDELFIKLLNLIISNKVNKTEEEVKYFYYIINPILEQEGLCYKSQLYNDDGFPIYQVRLFNKDDIMGDIPDNNIVFYVNKTITQGDNEMYFSLIPNSWDDYGFKNTFELFFYKDGVRTIIGELKIIDNEEKSSTKSLVGSFLQLASKYCSLASDISFYEKLKEIFPRNYLSILKALNDVAFFSIIADKFDNLLSFKNSLIRFDEQEQLLREARYRLYGYDLDNLYKFTYNFQSISQNSNGLKIKFNFDDSSLLGNVCAIIGKNGVGKTRLISQLPLDIANRQLEAFSPKIPLFSKVITVSYSVFDKFLIPDASSQFNYVYCGLRLDNNKVLDERELLNRFYKSMVNIEDKRRFFSWIEICKEFFSDEIVQRWKEDDIKFNKENFMVDQKTFSSGQSIFIFIMTEILSNIRLNSLIIFDEPETHLHPNGISQLVNSIHMLSVKFKSCCIIATHSPIVIQGLLSNKVYILRNENGVQSITHPVIETFGENLTVLTEEIFGNREIPSHFKKQIKNLIYSGYSYDQIVTILQSDKDTPLSLNASILLKSLFQ